MTMFNLLSDLFRPKMTRFTVLYTCGRGYNCFRSVEAADATAAAARCEAITHNFGALTAVLPYVGQ
ncbi:hypothetical protein [Synechococcus phage S-N03]|uniref:Uncharacterized protein n=1 Tax=Synechococcus phage S-N03 TaxID=2718943 RepID=A0A6G8R6B7_9CAUD|nr:hypothetical protein PQC09_gp063 [Synechococcus phage S-N03]QIN96698.1 hypothetical protein [Synechococcus phage S-N03]